MGFVQAIALEIAIGCMLWLPLLLAAAWMRKWSAAKAIGMGIFAVYLTAVFQLVGLPSLKYLRFEPDLYLGAFIGILDDGINSVMNVLLFLPMGFLVMCLRGENCTVRKSVVFGFCMSLLIEVSQMFSFRLTDVNDLVTNTFGAFLGALMAKPVFRKVRIGCSIKGICGLSLIVAVVLFFLWQYALDYVWTLR